MRQVGRLGVWYPVDRLDASGIRRLLRTVEDLGYSTFWYPEALGYESLSVASFMLANSTRLIVGSSIANICDSRSLHCQARPAHLVKPL